MSMPRPAQAALGNKSPYSDAKTNALTAAAAEIWGVDAWTADSVVYLPPELIQVTLPHANPGDAVVQWGRVNGKLSLNIQAHTYTNDRGESVSVGLPYGTVPRLLLYRLCREIRLRKARELGLGGSATEYVQWLTGSSSVTGGDNGNLRRVVEQSRRFMLSMVSIIDLRPSRDPISPKLKAGRDTAFFRVLDSLSENWDPDNPFQCGLWAAKLVFSQQFVKMAENSVPLDWRACASLRRSPLAMDLYAWLTYRLPRLAHPLTLTWRALHQQFGAQYKQLKNFAMEVRRQLPAITLLYRDAKIEFAYANKSTTRAIGLLLSPSKPHVARADA